MCVGLLVCVAGCDGEPSAPVESLTPEAQAAGEPGEERTAADLQAPVGLRRRVQQVLDAHSAAGDDVDLGEAAPEQDTPVSFYDPRSGSPFALLERGELSELLPTEVNFIRVLGESDDLSEEQAAALWARGDVRKAYEVCMHFAAAAYFARGYMDREIDRHIAGAASVSLADELAPAGAYLRAHVLDRQGFEAALDEAQRRARLELWNAPAGKDINYGDWCGDLHRVFEETTTNYYDIGIDPYLR